MARIDGEKLGEMLSGYIDGELDPRERQIIERVLREDESARQLLADLRRTAGAVSSLPRHAAPSSILADTQAALERSALLDDFPEPRAHQTRRRSSWAARLSMAAMVGLVVVTGWWFLSEQGGRDSKGKIELARREARVADSAKQEVGAETGWANDLNATLASKDTVRSNVVAMATVEQQLALGVSPGALQGQAFAAEPVRLQITVRDRTEREAVTNKLANALSTQRLANLESPVGGSRADAGASSQNFYYRGKAGVNFDASNEEQFLVRASPRQIDGLLADLAKPEDAVALVAGPLTVRGAENSRNVVQLLSNQNAGASTGAADDLAVTAEADRGADRPQDRDGGLIDGLLKAVGVDPKLVSGGAKPSQQPGAAPGESRERLGATDFRRDADEAPVVGTEAAKAKKADESAVAERRELPTAPPPLVDRRLQAATESSKKVGRVQKTAEPPTDAPVTMVIQIIESPQPIQPSRPAATKPDPTSPRKVAE